MTSRFARFAWGVLGYTLLVILFGAWVRISGSGAGCGDHWPTCHGQVVLRSPETKTLIEYTHRATSGLLGPLVIVQVIWAFVGAGRRRVVRNWALATLLLVVIEALIGAGLVLKQLVAEDDSVGRAVVVALHLGNTLALTMAGALTAWFGAGRSWPGLGARSPGRTLLIACWVALVLVGMSGAVTALGDTLFPIRPTLEEGLLAHLRDDLSPGAHFLVRLRVMHPVVAVLGAGVVLVTARYCAAKVQDAPTVGAGSKSEVLCLSRWVEGLIWVQLVIGAINIALGAPGWMQLLHLLVAQLLWICVVLLTFSVFGAWKAESTSSTAVKVS